MNKSAEYSAVEEVILKKSEHSRRYDPIEKINVIVVENFPELGKLAAYRFLEWAQNNEGSSISLPTGKTPEHFIKRVTHYLQNWDHPDIQRSLEENGVNPTHKPDMKSFQFIQIDEFYPINTKQHNSFYYYVYCRL